MSANPDKKRFPRAVAKEVARDLYRWLLPATERFIVDGSLRRGKEEVGDVEILYIPKTEVRREGLFDSVLVNLADEVLEGQLRMGALAKRTGPNGGTSWGDRNKFAVHRGTGIPVDLFATNEACWWNYLVCRTGPMESNTRIATEAIKRGWKWKPYSCGFCLLDNGEETETYQEMGSEEEVFAFVGLPYAQPRDRR